MADESKCECNSCSQINVDVICQTFAQTASRFNEQASANSAMAISNGTHLQHSYNTQSQQQLESTNNSRLVSDILLAVAAGRQPAQLPTT